MLYRKEQFSVLANHYGNEIFDKYNGGTVHTNCLISKDNQQAEVQYFATEFNETYEKLKANMLKETNHKLQLNQLKHDKMESYIAQHRPIPEDIYSTMCFDGYQQQFPETTKLFKFTLLIPLSIVNVEQGFSLMYFIGQEKHKKKWLLCLLYLNIIHFIWIVHFHLLSSYSYGIVLFLYDILLLIYHGN